MNRITRRRRIIYFLSIICTLFLYLCAFLAVSPRFSAGTYSIKGGAKQAFDDSLVFYGDNMTASVVMNMHLSPIHATQYRFIADNCLNSLFVNGAQVVNNVPFCDYTYGKDVDLSPYIHTGDNLLSFNVDNWTAEGGFTIRPSSWDITVLTIHAFFITMFLFFLYKMCRTFLFYKRNQDLVLIGIGGVFLRFIYFLATPYAVRSHDVQGHIDYVFYVLHHFSIPLPQQGWESYQPPLYYFLAALWILPAKLMGATQILMLDLLQLQAFIISCIALFIGTWIGSMLFSHKNQHQSRLWFAAFLAVFPGIIFSASRISNDTLMLLIFVLFLAFLWRYWDKGAVYDWWITLLVLVCSILTKSNAILLIVPFVVCIFLRERSWMRVKRIAQGMAILAISTGWYFLLRFFIHHQVHLVGNVQGVSSALFTTNWKWTNLFHLQPLNFIRYPYYSPWEDVSGRIYFWEVLIKSAFTGEWNFGIIVNNVLRIFYFLNFILLIIGFHSFILDILTAARKYLPIWFSGLCTILAAMVLEINLHCGGLQDFRYTTILVIPVTYYIVKGIDRAPLLIRPYLQYLYFFHISLLLLYFYLLVNIQA